MRCRFTAGSTVLALLASLAVAVVINASPASAGVGGTTAMRWS